MKHTGSALLLLETLKRCNFVRSAIGLEACVGVCLECVCAEAAEVRAKEEGRATVPIRSPLDTQNNAHGNLTRHTWDRCRGRMRRGCRFRQCWSGGSGGSILRAHSDKDERCDNGEVFNAREHFFNESECS